MARKFTQAYFREQGRIGGQQRAKLTPEERRVIAKRGWDTRRAVTATGERNSAAEKDHVPEGEKNSDTTTTSTNN